MQVIQYADAGAASDVLSEADLPPVPPGPGEVQVRIAYSAVNPTDVKRRATGRELPLFSPIVPGNDGSGIVAAVGDGVDPARVGERVWVFGAQAGRQFGTTAEVCNIPAWMAPTLPDAASLLDGACLGVPAVTAHYGVFSDGLIDGQTVLVSGAAGRVGQYAVQMAKHGGAKVIATAGNPENLKTALKLGADHVIDYKADDVVQAVLDLTGGKGVDRVVEVAFGANCAMYPDIVAENGVITTYSSDAVPEPQIPFLPIMFKCLTMRPFTIYALPAEKKYDTFEAINDMLAEGLLKHNVGKHCPFTLAGVVEAHEAIENDAAGGVCVIEVDPSTE